MLGRARKAVPQDDAGLEGASPICTSWPKKKIIKSNKNKKTKKQKNKKNNRTTEQQNNRTTEQQNKKKPASGISAHTVNTSAILY
jgi:hypothetical protein